MRRLTSSFFLILNLVSAAVFSQESPEKSKPTSWYTSDGSNELVLMVMDDFALFESQLWEIDQTTSERVVLKNGDKNLALLISKNGDSYTLVNGDKKTPIQPQKSKDLRNRKVGQTDVSNDFFNKDQVLLQGVVLPKESMPSTISITYNHAFGDGQRQFSGEVDEQGRFKVIFPLEYPQEVMVIIGRAIFKLFSTPGAKQAIVVDESSFNMGISSWTELKNIDFMGDLAVENEERRRLEPEFMKVRDYLVTDSMQKNLEPEAFIAYRLDLMKKHEAFYERYFDSIPVSSLVQDISKRSVRIHAADDLRRYIWLHRKIVDGRLSPVDVSDDYIRGVKNLLTNDLEDLMTSEFANLMREFTMPIQPSEMKVISDQMNQLTYELFKKLDLTETQLSGVEAWYDQIKKGVPRDSLVTSEEFKELSKSHQSTIFKFFKEAQWPHLLAKIATR